MRDPRSHRRYVESSAAYIAALGGAAVPCAICREPVNTTLPRTHRLGPTIEHRLPIRHIRATAQTWAQAVTLACDTTLWGIAHRGCQDRQGAQVRAAQTAGRMVGASRVW